MALSANVKYLERMEPAEFGGLVASGYHVYFGALVGWDALGNIVPLQASTCVAFAGIAGAERDNTSGTELRPLGVRKGVWGLTISGATPANIGATVYAADDNTVALGSLSAAAAAKSGNTGNGTFGTITPPSTAKVGAYVLTLTSATAFSLVDPNGDELAPGAVGTAYSSFDLGFTLTAGATAFVAGDAFTITVSQASGRAIGTLAGIDNGQTYVRLS
jgi:hypothetical protein